MLTRRTFVAAGAAAPIILGAQSKSGSKNPILGSGEHTYECIHDWGEKPEAIAYGNCHAVVEDSEGHILVHHTVHKESKSEDTIVVYDNKGKFVRSFAPEFKGGAHGMDLRREGKTDYLYLADTRRAAVVKMTTKGEKVWEIGYPEMAEPYHVGSDGKKKKYSPTNVAVAPNGDVYVADGYGSYYINQYDKNAKYIRTIGTVGKGEREINNPHGIWVDTRGKEPRLLVADRGNNRLQYFSMTGEWQSTAGNVKKPCHFHERKGVLLIPDLDARVTLLDKENKLIVHLGEDTTGDQYELRKKARTDFRPGKFVCPHGANFDKQGNIFVAEWVEVGRVTKLRKV